MAKRSTPGQLGLFRPDSDWTPPSGLPDLRGRPLVALDTETKDEGLNNNRGPGWAYGASGGHICGVSWAAEGSAGYAPVRHPDTECLDEDVVKDWVRALLRSGTRVVFHNAGYDLGWLGTWLGEPVQPEPLEDTAAMAVMIDENMRSYSLDSVCEWLGVPGKDQELLEKAAHAYGTDAKAGLWRLPARYVGPYATQDTVATLGCARQMQPMLEAQGLQEAYRLECDLIPMIVAMRRQGIRVDLDEADRLLTQFRHERDVRLKIITEHLQIGRAVTVDDVRSSQFLERIFTAEGIRFPRTEKTKKGSFQGDWMEVMDHWLPKNIVRALRWNDAADKFVQNFVIDHAHRGRIHGEIHQFRTDDGGTRSHRFSYSAPPLQQMTSPDGGKAGRRSEGESKIIGKAVRGMFLPERGERWLSADYSSQEPRLTVHFAAEIRATGVDAVVQQYLDNPRTDYHQVVADMVDRPRPVAKILNLAMTYGKGAKATAEELGVSLAEGKEILEGYHRMLPYIKALEDTCKRRAAERGYIRLIDGARMHYNKWEGPYMDAEAREYARQGGHRLDPCSREEAERRQENPEHPWARARLRRADTRKALNNLVQGSAARQTKIAMREIWRAGETPLLQMHDEVCLSVRERRQVDLVQSIMVSAVKLRVPVVVDAELGNTWATAKTLADDVNWAEAA